MWQINHDYNYKYNYHPSSYNSLLGKRELDTNTRKILEKYNLEANITTNGTLIKKSLEVLKKSEQKCTGVSKAVWRRWQFC